jgi:outer membrane lipase/esterase
MFMKHTFFGRALPALTLATVALASLPAGASPYTSMVVFGDSLSDNGNNAALGLYAPGQVITGNTYVPTNTYARLGPTATDPCGRRMSRRQSA